MNKIQQRYISGNKSQNATSSARLTYVGCHFSRNDLIVIVTDDEVQMSKKISLTAPHHFTSNHIFVINVSEVSPHWKIFYKHFEKVIVVDGILQFDKVLLYKVHLTQQSPFDAVIVRNFIWRRFAPVTDNRFAEPLSVFHCTNDLITFEVVTKFDLLRNSS